MTVTRGEVIPPVINISHPRPVRWAHIIGIFEDLLKYRAGINQALSILSFREWNERVISAASRVDGPRHNSYKQFPSTKIQHVFDKMAHANEALLNSEDGVNAEACIGTAKLDVNQATRLSKSLRDAPSLGKEHVEKWVSYWEKRVCLSLAVLAIPYNRRCSIKRALCHWHASSVKIV